MEDVAHHLNDVVFKLFLILPVVPCASRLAKLEYQQMNDKVKSLLNLE